MLRQVWFLSGSLLVASTACGLDLDDYRLIDLTHAYNADTVYWPTATSKFELTTLAAGETAGGFYYSAYAVSTPEHGGTHLDAPVHFNASGLPNHALPLEQLIAPAVVIDVTAQARADRNYRLSVADVLDFEARHGMIAAGTMVLLRTDWSERWPNVADYMGDDTPGDASHLSFPGYGTAAATLLVEERRVGMLGIDTASIDYGASQDFPVHRLAAARNVAGLENLTNLAALPATGATVLALPMKIEGGSGGPVRVVALVER
jgi:kynurenine formamidase